MMTVCKVHFCMVKSQSLFQQMVFCNVNTEIDFENLDKSHNPYFSRWFSAILFIGVHITTFERVTILILVDGFLQFEEMNKEDKIINMSQSLFQQMVFCNGDMHKRTISAKEVTILILVDGFLQQIHTQTMMILLRSQSLFQQMVFCNIYRRNRGRKQTRHNPYFSRWFSAIALQIQMNL